MSVEELIKAIPQIMLYIVPGFIVVKITETYTPRKKVSQYETILWSIFYSFVVLLLYAFGAWAFRKMYSWICNKGCTITVSQEVRYLIYFLLSGLLGYVVTKLYNSKIGELLTKKVNPNIQPGEDVWFAALRSSKVAWVTVYLKNGLIYTGALTKYTSNPDDTDRLILLTNFRRMVRTKYPEHETQKENRICDWVAKKESNSFCEVIDDYIGNNEAKVLLKYEDIVSIEFVKKSNSSKT